MFGSALVLWCLLLQAGSGMGSLSWHGLESVEDQISANICRVVQVPEPDLVTRGVAVDLLQMAKRVGPQCKGTEYEDLSREKNFTLDCVVVDD